jgi:hypothetical protein
MEESRFIERENDMAEYEILETMRGTGKEYKAEPIAEKTVDELILEIMKIAMKKNDPYKNTIFVWYSGHIHLLEITVYENGYRTNVEPDYSKWLNLKNENIIKELKEVIKYLKGLEG